jgi:hypothetical protein
MLKQTVTFVVRAVDDIELCNAREKPTRKIGRRYASTQPDISVLVCDIINGHTDTVYGLTEFEKREVKSGGRRNNEVPERNVVAVTSIAVCGGIISVTAREAG